MLYLAAGLMSAFNGLQRPSLDAMTPRLVPSDEIPAVAALTALRGSLGMIVGPAIGGVLVATAGAVAAFGVDAASFLASLACFAAMRSMPPRDDAEAPTWRSIVEGFRYARSRQELIGTYVVDFVAMVFGMPLALFPALAAGPLGGAALGPALRRARRRRARRQPDLALDAAGPSSRPRGDGGGHRLGRRHRRLRLLAHRCGRRWRAWPSPAAPTRSAASSG